MSSPANRLVNKDGQEITSTEVGSKRLVDVSANVANSSGTIIDPATEGSLGKVTPATNLEGNGKISVGTTAVEITFTGTPKAITIRADKDNTGIIYYGKSNVDSSGNNAITFLEAGEIADIMYDDTTNAIYVVSDTASQNVWAGAFL